MLGTCDRRLVVVIIIIRCQWIEIIIKASNQIVVVIIVYRRVERIEFIVEIEILEGTEARIGTQRFDMLVE